MSFWSSPSFSSFPRQKHRWVVYLGQQLKDLNEFKNPLPFYFAKSVDRPSYTLKSTQTKLLYSHTVNFPTRPVWNPITVTFYDARINTTTVFPTRKSYIKPELRLKPELSGEKDITDQTLGRPFNSNISTAGFFYNFLQDVGYYAPIEERNDKSLFMRKYNFKEDIIKNIQPDGDKVKIVEIDEKGFFKESWFLNNPIITDVKFDKFDYSSEEVALITATIAYDWAEYYDRTTYEKGVNKIATDREEAEAKRKAEIDYKAGLEALVEDATREKGILQFDKEEIDKLIGLYKKATGKEITAQQIANIVDSRNPIASNALSKETDKKFKLQETRLAFDKAREKLDKAQNSIDLSTAKIEWQALRDKYGLLDPSKTPLEIINAQEIFARDLPEASTFARDFLIKQKEIKEFERELNRQGTQIINSDIGNELLTEAQPVSIIANSSIDPSIDIRPSQDTNIVITPNQDKSVIIAPDPLSVNRDAARSAAFVVPPEVAAQEEALEQLNEALKGTPSPAELTPESRLGPQSDFDPLARDPSGPSQSSIDASRARLGAEPQPNLKVGDRVTRPLTQKELDAAADQLATSIQRGLETSADASAEENARLREKDYQATKARYEAIDPEVAAIDARRQARKDALEAERAERAEMANRIDANLALLDAQREVEQKAALERAAAERAEAERVAEAQRRAAEERIEKRRAAAERERQRILEIQRFRATIKYVRPAQRSVEFWQQELEEAQNYNRNTASASKELEKAQQRLAEAQQRLSAIQ